MVADVRPGFASSHPRYFIEFDNSLYFRAYSNSYGFELWEYDGTNAPTMVADIISGPGSGDPEYLTVLNNELYLSVNDGTHGTELCKFSINNIIKYS